MNYDDYIKQSRECVRVGLLRLRADIVAFAAAFEFEPQTHLDWNLCVCSYSHGTHLRRLAAWPGLNAAQFCGVVYFVVKSIVLGSHVDTFRSRHSRAVRGLLEFLGVNFERKKIEGAPVKMCYWCRERMTPEHRLCKKNNVGSAARMLATYDAGMYKTLKYVTISPPPPREELPRVCATRMLPQPIAEEVAEHII